MIFPDKNLCVSGYAAYYYNKGFYQLDLTVIQMETSPFPDYNVCNALITYDKLKLHTFLVIDIKHNKISHIIRNGEIQVLK